MSVKRQHYVPQVYLKAWETMVACKQTPNRYFDGIYYYEKSDLETGNGKNKDSVLWKPRIYTVNYDLSFIIPSCQKTQEDYIRQVAEKLKTRKVNAYYNGKVLETEQDLAENFLKLDEWEFQNNETADIPSKKKILNHIKQTNSYVIESALDSVVESKWEQTLNDFIDQMETTVPLNGIDEIRQINENTVLDVVKMIIFLICRNPEFDYLGILTWLKEEFLDSLLIDDEDKRKIIKTQLDAVWLKEMYMGLFDIPKGYFNTLKQAAKSSFQIMLYKVWEDQGSFITSDKPAFEHISLVESSNLNSIICPLTPQYLIMIMRGESNSLKKVNFRKANHELIRKFNRIILNHAEKSIVSNCKHLGYIL